MSKSTVTPEWKKNLKEEVIFWQNVFDSGPEIDEDKVEDFISQTLQELLAEVEEIIGEDEKSWVKYAGHPEWDYEEKGSLEMSTRNKLRQEMRLKLADIKRRWIK